MPVKRLRTYFPLVQLLAKKRLSFEQFKSIIHSINPDAVKFICECCRNSISTGFVSSLNGNKKRSFLKVITPHKKLIKSLCRRRKNYTRSKKPIIQRGYGFLIPLLATILPMISSLIKNRTKT